MTNPVHRSDPLHRGFTLIELLVVISIISLLISILLPSMSRARDQAKGVHCLARLKDIGTALATYENVSSGVLPPARWLPNLQTKTSPQDRNRPQLIRPAEYGWIELLYSHVYLEEVNEPDLFPVQRNVQPGKWNNYFLCKAVGDEGSSSGHYRVYLPSWSAGSYNLDANGRWTDQTRADPNRSASRERIRPKLPLLGDANEYSERGDGLGDDDCSFIDAGEANYAGTDGRRGNRFSDRHYGGTNFLFQDLHAEWLVRLRQELARDFDLNGIEDISGQ